MKDEEIVFVFNPSVLEKGDILLINTCNKRVQEKIGSKYDHAALYAGDALIVESDGCGVLMNHLFSYGFKSADDAVVLRSVCSSTFFREGVLFYARTVMGMEFGSLEMARVPRFEKTDETDASNRMFCSRLVAQSCEKMGVKIVPNPNYCSPASFLESKYLKRVENPLMRADEATKKTVVVQSRNRESAESVECLVDLFQKLSAFYGKDIQAMDQLIWASLENPGKDDDAIGMIMRTEYYQRRLEGRDFYCLNDKESFERKYDSLERRLFFLLNQDLHLEKTYIPSVSSNAQTFLTLSAYYPESKLIAFFKDFFGDACKELRSYHAWVAKLLMEIIEENPDGVKAVLAEEAGRD